MKGLNRVKAFLLRVWHSLFFKYAIVTIVGVAIVGFLDENSFWSHFKNMQRISELREETEHYNADYRRDQARIRELDRDPKAMEKIARERYFMKADDEDIFVLSDDGELENPIQKHETTK
jgi:cell division protein FtsB